MKFQIEDKANQRHKLYFCTKFLNQWLFFQKIIHMKRAAEEE